MMSAISANGGIVQSDFHGAASQPAAMRLNKLDAGSVGGGSSGQTKADPEAMRQAADALVGLRGSTESVDNQASEDSLDASKHLNKHTLGTAPDDGSWLTAGGLVKMDVRWGAQVIHLKGILRDISEKLHDTRNSYTEREKAENAAYQRMRADFG